MEPIDTPEPDVTARTVDGAEPPMQRVDPRSVAVWRWRLLIVSAVLLVATTPASLSALSAAAARPEGAIGLAMAWLLGLGALALAVWKYPPARYRHLGFAIDETGITIESGIFWRAQSAVPCPRIQHTDVSQGPLQRRYGVATLKLYTAGSRYTRIELPGLGYADAVALRDRLQPSAGDDAV